MALRAPSPPCEVVLTTVVMMVVEEKVNAKSMIHQHCEVELASAYKLHNETWVAVMKT